MIYPMFERLVQNQWVNAGFLRDFGWGSPSDFLAPDTLQLLAEPVPDAGAAAATDLRALSRSRPTRAWNTAPCRRTTVTASICRRRTRGNGWRCCRCNTTGCRSGPTAISRPTGRPAASPFPQQLEDLPLAEQPAALDRAVLDECLGGPFHPGCELTWPMRQTLLYEAPFRLRRRIASRAATGVRR